LSLLATPVRHGYDWFALKVHHAPDGGGSEALDAHLSEVRGRASPVDRAVCNGPIDQVEHLGTELLGILLIGRKVVLRVGRTGPVV
jgi:hypothetical protein